MVKLYSEIPGKGFRKMRLYFIRHAQSENNALYERTGSENGRSDDPRLSELGKVQAQHLAEFIMNGFDPTEKSNGKGFAFTHIYCSPMYRAIATGTYISQALGQPLKVWKDWHECGGMYLTNPITGEKDPRPGITLTQAREWFPELLTEGYIKEDGWWNRPFEEDGERDVRARRVLKELLSRHGGTDDCVAVVSHAGFYVHFLTAVMGLESLRPLWFRMHNAGISRFDFETENTVLVFHNFVSYLPPDLRSV